MILLAVAGAIFYGLWRATRTSWAMCIIAGPEQVKFVRGIAAAQQVKISQFLRDDITLAEPITILANKRPSGQLQLKITGDIDDGLRQRIRNYLFTVL